MYGDTGRPSELFQEICEIMSDGANALAEYDLLAYQLWQSFHGRELMPLTLEQVAFFKGKLKGDGVWDIYKFYSDEALTDLKMRLDRAKGITSFNG